MRIWKWSLRVADEQILELPEGAQILDVQIQGGMPQLWALVNPTAPKQPRNIAIYGTGHPVPENPGTYIASFQMHDGALAFHAFEA